MVAQLTLDINLHGWNEVTLTHSTHMIGGYFTK